MQKTELYLEDNLYLQLEKVAEENNLTISDYISNLLKTTLKKEKTSFKQMTGIWRNKNIDLKDIRKRAWIH